MSNLTTQLMTLPRPWEITMDYSGHFYRHAATLICTKEEDDPKVFDHLLFRAGCDNAYPEIMANVCCFPVDERGWVDYNHQLDPWEQHLHGLREGQSYSFGSDLMLEILNYGWSHLCVTVLTQYHPKAVFIPRNSSTDLKTTIK